MSFNFLNVCFFFSPKKDILNCFSLLKSSVYKQETNADDQFISSRWASAAVLFAWALGLNRPEQLGCLVGCKVLA